MTPKIYLDSRTILTTLDNKCVVRPYIDIYNAVHINDDIFIIPNEDFVQAWNEGKCVQEAIKSCLVCNTKVAILGDFS